MIAVAAVAAALGAGPPASNETILSARQSQRLVSYAATMRSCLSKGGLRVGELHVTRKLIEFPVLERATMHEVAQRGVACGQVVGDPPRIASVQSFADRVVIYIPKQCLLDPDVVGTRVD
jgi:hypothetical protein